MARDAACHRPGPVLQTAGPDGKVKPILHQVDDAVGKRQFKFERRVLSCKVEQDRGNASPAQERRHCHAQSSAWFGNLLRHESVGSLCFREHHPATFIVDAPEVRQALAARGPVDEPHAQVLFKKPDMLADHWRR